MERETRLQNQIISALNSRGHYARNHTVGQFYTKYGAIIHVGTHGESDIDGHRKDGRAIYLEVKLPGQVPRDDQLRFLDAMRNTGAIAGWCTSVEEAIRIVEETP